MRRAPWYVVTGAVAGFAAVLGLHGLAGTPAALSRSAPTGGQGGGDGTGSHQSGGNGGSGNGAAGGGPAASPSPRGGGTTARVRTVTGTAVNYGYGKLAVKVTMKGNQITGVSLASLRTVDPFSQQLAGQVIPVLRSEVLRAHSVRINAVSGATFTSQAYVDSIQSALDKLNVG
jgi:FMN-binding protein